MARQILLIVLGALLLAAGWHYLLPISGPDRARDHTAPEPARVPTRSSGVAAKQEYPGNQLATLDMVRLELARPHSAVGRDPWRFQDPPLRKLTPPKAEPAAVLPPSQPSVPTPPAAAVPKLTLEYLGSFGPREKRIAVLSGDGRTFNALEGEMIEGRFIVERIGYESVEIRRVGMPGGPAERLGLRRR